MKTFSEELKDARKIACISQKGAAELIGVPFRTYQNWEYAINVPNQFTQEVALNKIKNSTVS